MLFYEERDRLVNFLTQSIYFYVNRKENVRMKESRFQHDLIKDLEKMFPGCYVMKIDSSYIQGFPDLLVLYKNQWAVLECKRCATASKQPNQAYYVEKLNEMSFSRFIFPENKKEVLYDLQQAFQS